MMALCEPAVAETSQPGQDGLFADNSTVVPIGTEPLNGTCPRNKAPGAANTGQVNETQVDQAINVPARRQEILQAVEEYQSRGIHTFPQSRNKTPVVKEWNDRDFTPEQHKVNGFEAIGTCPGRWAGNVMVFDVDGPQGRESWAKCLEQYGPLPDTWTVHTGRVDGGEHHYYMVPDGLFVKSTASRFAEKVDLRGTRGQAVLPPTVHRSGKVYQWHYAGKPCYIPDPEKIPLLPEPWVKALIDKEQANFPDQSPPAPSPRPFSGNTCKYAETALQAEVNLVATALVDTRNDTLNKAAFSLGQLVAGGELDHNTVESELMAAATAAGLDSKEIPKTIRSGMSAGAKSPRQAPKPTFKSNGAGNQAEKLQNTTALIWENPISLESDAAKPMKPELLPEALRLIVQAVSEATETPPELATGMGIGVLSTVCQGKMVIEVRQGYQEPLNTSNISALPPAHRKSAVANIMTEPLRIAENDIRERAKPVVKDIEIHQKNIQARLKKLRTKYGNAKPAEIPAIENEIIDLEDQVEPIPPLPRLWAEDVTPEHLGTMLHEHNEKMSIISSEGGIFDMLGGRYSNGIPNLDIYLKGHACEPGRVDRGSRDTVYLERPCLTIALAPQPAVLYGLAGKPGFRGRGLLARFLYFLPESKLGFRKLETEPVPDKIAQLWLHLVNSLLSIEPRLDNQDRVLPYIIKLSNEAAQEWGDFWNIVEVEMRPGGRFEQIPDWAGKLPGAAARIAGLFHCIENPDVPWEKKVTKDTMIQSLELAASYADHALVAFGLMGGDPALEGAKKVWRWIESGRHQQVSRRDCFQALKGTFPRVEEIKEPLNVLVERNYIRIESKQTGGRPTEVITVNPEIMRTWT
jgi:hypothetical protein